MGLIETLSHRYLLSEHSGRTWVPAPKARNVEAWASGPGDTGETPKR